MITASVQQLVNSLWVGMGCQKGISSELIDIAIERTFQTYQLAYTDLAGIASIDIKASELGVREFCRIHNLPLKTFTAEVLAGVSVPNPGKIITETVGTPSVAEAAAILAASHNTSAVSLLVPKQIFRLPGEVGAVTIAVAGCRV
ncbi:cobalamin biosynthesis protein [Sphaerospermopsis kisseleviana CS-549]|uniref:Cobalamin (Vitamin B12) biosynthesis CbiG protein n=2 Tax=Sphaerospermopsis TaxID=752201 RepID=A0A480A288_9CYAN|nr:MULTISPECIES: cobalamin biosynthesis protein [Sphaerospermopsis]BAZ80080.1 cobalamin (vitamin B12) biosynthesis CbiG protein [Sphaerospermopsis kisseleviana NIES-73]MBD2134830.1 cobalamin biosynthesis protein [Sphaerospermopsis sp. FACHB-1094]MBD2145515.1 cobalamin biosynthesis protein [Sphaerospermopsis sp. FACHB-1194]MDB9442294.1 cobalamin biosynthesis protein [Sphaerospermopsis kisseleviana CS-549]GCL38959.1 cobalamin (vitamin B12) biosynthesis CbiG protein [Sphaerospermopsis reniformis]